MSTKINTRKEATPKFDVTARLAGGAGGFAALEGDDALLRRLIMANLLWENQFYVDGKSVADEIARLIPLVEPEKVALMAIDARQEQKLRHVPLFIAREMTRYSEHNKFVESVLSNIVTRADMITDFLALYRKDSKSIPHSVRRGLETAFRRFKAYHFAKYAGKKSTWSMSDAIRVIRPTPVNEVQSELFKAVRHETMEAADTWEVALSTGKNAKETWERLISEEKLGAMAFLRNLHNMERAGVQKAVILYGFEHINPGMLLPINFFAAATAVPSWSQQIEGMMLRSLENMEKLPGTTVLVVDVSGSMTKMVSEKSKFNRLAIASMLAVMTRSICQFSEIWVTAGNDNTRVHSTKKIVSKNSGFALADEIVASKNHMGGGGIFTRQALEHIKKTAWVEETPTRVIVFSDSQDIDELYGNKSLPKPFGKYNYIVDISAEVRGINYKGVWNGGQVSGWSDQFLTWIAANEGISLVTDDQDTEQSEQ